MANHPIIVLDDVPEETLALARIIYAFAPETQSWNGEAYDFSEVLTWEYGWGGTRSDNMAARAIRQTQAALAHLARS